METTSRSSRGHTGKRCTPPPELRQGGNYSPLSDPHIAPENWPPATNRMTARIISATTRPMLHAWRPAVIAYYSNCRNRTIAREGKSVWMSGLVLPHSEGENFVLFSLHAYITHLIAWSTLTLNLWITHIIARRIRKTCDSFAYSFIDNVFIKQYRLTQKYIYLFIKFQT